MAAKRHPRNVGGFKRLPVKTIVAGIYKPDAVKHVCWGLDRGRGPPRLFHIDTESTRASKCGGPPVGI